jgi:hypothetical protein
MDKVNAMRPSRGPLGCKDRWVRRDIATEIVLGRIPRSFLRELPTLFHSYLAAVLFGSETPPFHASHGDDCYRLLPNRRCLGDRDGPNCGFLDPKGYTPTLVRKTVMAIGFATAAIAMATCAANPGTYLPWLLAVGVGCGISRLGHVRILADPRGAARGRPMDRLAKWFRQLGRCSCTCLDGVCSGADRQFCDGNGSNGNSVDNRWAPVGFRSWPS